MYATAVTQTYRDASAINAAMGRVYFHMMLAVVTSMLVSMGVASSPALMQFLFGSWVKWIVILAPLAAVFGVTMALNSDPPRSIAVAMLHGFAAIMGLSFATVFVVYTMGSIVSAFMGGAILFGVMSFYGYFTRRSLDSVGRFMFVGLIAIVIASIVNLFIGSTVMQMVISALAIVIFLGLTAYDTQQIREAVSIDNQAGTVEIVGALTLYLNFINLFLALLQLLGGRRE